MLKASKRYIVRDSCGCRVPDPDVHGKLPAMPGIRRCEFHGAAADDML